MSRELQGYERYKLEWMIEHGYSLGDLFDRMDDIVDELYDRSDYPLPSEAFEKFGELGFASSEIWACEGEWKDNEAQEEDHVSYNVGFINEDGMEDETQFDVPVNYNQTQAISEIMSLFNTFCDENNIKCKQITFIAEAEWVYDNLDR